MSVSSIMQTTDRISGIAREKSVLNPINQLKYEESHAKENAKNLKEPKAVNLTCAQQLEPSQQLGEIEDFAETFSEAPLDLSLSETNRNQKKMDLLKKSSSLQKLAKETHNSGSSGDISFKTFSSAFSNAFFNLFCSEFPQGLQASNYQSYTAFLTAAATIYPYILRSWTLYSAGFFTQNSESLPIEFNTYELLKSSRLSSIKKNSSFKSFVGEPLNGKSR